MDAVSSRGPDFVLCVFHDLLQKGHGFKGVDSSIGEAAEEIKCCIAHIGTYIKNNGSFRETMMIKMKHILIIEKHSLKGPIIFLGTRKTCPSLNLKTKSFPG